MAHQENSEEWLWRMYREVAQFVHNPSVTSEAELMSLIAQYRKEQGSEMRSKDEHEWVMNYQ